MEIEYEVDFNENSVILLIEALYNMEYQIGKVQIASWTNLTLYYISRLSNRVNNS